MGDNSGRGSLLKVGLSAALAGGVFGAGGWVVASQWGGQADARAPEHSAGRPRAASTTGYDREFGNIYYKVPAGYSAAQTEKGVIMVRTADAVAHTVNVGGELYITDGYPLVPELRKKLAENKMLFIQGIAALVSDLTSDPNAQISNPAAVNANSAAKDGYEAFAVTSVSFDKDKQQKVFTTYLIVITPSRVEVIMEIGFRSAANKTALDAGLDALGGSLEFKDAGAPPPARFAAALPANLKALVPKPKADESEETASAPVHRGGGGNCAVRYRQQCGYTGAGTSYTGVGQSYALSCYTVPYTPPGCK